MTINGGQPHRVGYEGQKYRVVVDEEGHGVRTICWSNTIPPKKMLKSLETRPSWTNARYEETGGVA